MIYTAAQRLGGSGQRGCPVREASKLRNGTCLLFSLTRLPTPSPEERGFDQGSTSRKRWTPLTLIEVQPSLAAHFTTYATFEPGEQWRLIHAHSCHTTPLDSSHQAHKTTGIFPNIISIFRLNGKNPEFRRRQYYSVSGPEQADWLQTFKYLSSTAWCYEIHLGVPIILMLVHVQNTEALVEVAKTIAFVTKP